MKQRILIIFLCVIWSTALYGQSTVESFTEQLEKNWSKYPNELTYIQTSKGIYETGEDLWFKAYQLDVQTMGLSNRSKTFYLQMVDTKDSIVWQEKYPVEQGLVSGHVYIDEKLPEGDYLLEGYTKNSFYEKDTLITPSVRRIKVVKNIRNSFTPDNQLRDTTFRFSMFPEGGYLINGIVSRLAFKATNGKGTPSDIEGLLYENDKPITTVKSKHDGMGSVMFTPVRDRVYEVKLNNGKSYTLPKVQIQGISLRLLRQNKENVDFIISQSYGLPQQMVYLIGHMRGKVYCMAKGVLKDNLKMRIPLSNFLYQGIAEFTLLNEAMEPIAERLVYVHPEKKLYITAEPEKKHFKTREKATIKIKVTDDKGNPIKAHLGVSVYDQAYDYTENKHSLPVYCYLSSQIRGNIYNPTYYFDEENSDRIEALDLLLLTQGWRRYVWHTSNNSYSGRPFLLDEIVGIQTVKNRKKSVETLQLIQVSGAERNTTIIEADSLGHFFVNTDLMKELRGGYVYFKSLLPSNNKPILELVDFFNQINSIRGSRQSYFPKLTPVDEEEQPLLNLPIVSSDTTVLLDGITVTGKAQRLFRDKMMGHLDSLAQINFGPWVCEHGFLENYLLGYTHHHNPEYCPCPITEKERNTPIVGKSYALLKAQYYECIGEGNRFSVIDRRTIVYEGPEYSEEELLRLNNIWRTKGYYALREFYQPDEVDLESPIPDSRNTLFWSPFVVTDEKGEAIISFYCSDINTGFIGRIEGINGLNLLGSTICNLRVIK